MRAWQSGNLHSVGSGVANLNSLSTTGTWKIVYFDLKLKGAVLVKVFENYLTLDQCLNETF